MKERGIEVLAVQANRDDPSDSRNKIAFTLGGALCFVTNPEAAHLIIKGALQQLEFDSDYRGEPETYQPRKGELSDMVARLLSHRTDLAKIAKRA